MSILIILFIWVGGRKYYIKFFVYYSDLYVVLKKWNNIEVFRVMLWVLKDIFIIEY